MICDYVYTSEGLRAESGRVVVKLSWPDGTTRTLSVVRSGKGRSRLDRWESNPRPDGVTGEINTRDLQAWMEQNGVTEIDGTLDADGVRLEVSLERDALMGRAGRAHTGFREYLDSLGDRERRAAALLMLKNMPYGLENTEDFQERTDASLGVLDDGDIKALLESGNFNFLGHLGDDALYDLAQEHGDVLKKAGEVAAWLPDKMAALVRITEGMKLARAGDTATVEYIKKNGLTAAEISKIIESGSMKSAAFLAETMPEQAALLVRNKNVSKTVRAYVLAYLPAELLVPEDIEDLLTTDLVKALQEAHEFFTTDGRTFDNYRAEESDNARAETFIKLFKIAGIENSSKIKEMTFTDDRLYGFDDLVITPPVAMAGLSWALDQQGERNLEKDTAGDILEILLRNNARSGYRATLAAGSRLSGSSFLLDANSDKDISQIAIRHEAPVSEFISYLLSEVDVDIVSGLTERHDKNVTPWGYKTHRSETFVAAAFPEYGERLEAILKNDASYASEWEDSPGSYKHRPGFGIIQAHRGAAQARLWLEETFSFHKKEARDLTFFNSSVLRDLSHPDAGPFLVAAVAASVKTVGDPDFERELLSKTEASSGASDRNSLRDLFKDDKLTSSSGRWHDIRTHGAIAAPEYSSPTVAARLRAGIALGTESNEVLLKLMDNPREIQAGPIAALRIIGHPDVPPTKNPVAQEHVDRARKYLSDHQEAGRRATVGDLISEASQVLKAGGFLESATLNNGVAP